MIKLIVGLGNPGREYQYTRHNAGFHYLNNLAQQLALKFSFESKYFGEIARTRIAGKELWLLKPLTYMNLSGKAVHALASFYKIDAAQILVAHDELDFKPGTVKLKQGGGNGGHNGLKDIDRVIGKNYWRLRIGIGHPGERTKVVAYVLNAPPTAEKIAIDLAVEQAVAITNTLIDGNYALAQKILHTNLA